ncbi:chaplin [Phytomonospora sp. NPDC050363]|uniref:chaplin n=1 Tax=Phytomonospora sp. NPDC050363 TaxID=3155642 RepID=UPI0033F41D8A
MRKTWARTATRAGALAAGLLLFLGSGAHAAELVSDDESIGANGSQLLSPLQSPLDTCGDRLNLGDAADTACETDGDARVGVADMRTQDNEGILNGNQIQAPVQVPVNACAVAATLLGSANSTCVGGATATAGGGEGTAQTMDSRRNKGIGNGNQLLAPVQVPVNVCGLAVPVLGTARASCAGSATATMGQHGGMTTSDNDGMGNGNTLVVPVQVPINVCGNAIAAVGDSQADCLGGSDAQNDTKVGGVRGTDREAPTQLNLPLLGDDQDDDSGARDAKSVVTARRDGFYSGTDSTDNRLLGGGNQLLTPIQLPTNLSGNSIGGAGTADALSLGGAVAALH